MQDSFKSNLVDKLDSQPVRGYDFNKGIDYHEIFKSYATCGI